MVVRTQIEAKNFYANIPQELQEYPQWVVWRSEPRKDGKFAKIPYNPRTGKRADSVNPHTWATYQEAKEALKNGTYQGIGFVFSEEDPYVGIDLDDCRDPQTGEIQEWAQTIITRFGTYTEISPSHTGVKLFLKGKLSGERHKTGDIEIYDNKRFFTLTGRSLLSPDIQPKQRELDTFYREVFPKSKEVARKREEKPQELVGNERPLPPIQLADQELLERARQSAYGERFRRLWAGDWQDLYFSQSEADLSLCGMLAFWAGGQREQMDTLFRQSGLYRVKWDEQRGKKTYGEMTIEAALKGNTEYYQPGSGKKRQDRRADTLYSWQASTETTEQREQVLRAKAEEITEQVAEHVSKGGQSNPILGIATPPGTGKSHSVSEWGKEKNVAYIVPRHNQVQSIPALQHYNVILPPTEETCSEYLLHNELAVAGYNTWYAHSLHPVPCAYRLQFGKRESAVYQIAHATTIYPSEHSAIVIDEFTITDWYTTRTLDASALKKAKNTFAEELPAYHLLDAFHRVMIDSDPSKAIQGKAFFDALNKKANGQLETLVHALRKEYSARDRHPNMKEGSEIAPIVLPHLWFILDQEIQRWKHGGDWNSALRMVGDLLFLTEPRRFQAREGQAVPPIVVLDATMEQDVLQRWAGETPVQLIRQELPPPPQTQHIGVRAARYGKTSLTKNGEYFKRTLAQVRYLFREREIAPEQVGIITYKDIVQKMGNALGIPETQRLHFFGARGSNALEGCEILLVIGTPALDPESTYRLARAVYHDDPIPLIEISQEQEDGTYSYQDQRIQRFAEYITRSELTQAAHRNRPLRYDGRMILSLTNQEIDFLPVTTRIEQLPTLTEDGEVKEDDTIERLEQAYEEVVRAEMNPTVRRIANLAGVKTETARMWLQRKRTK